MAALFVSEAGCALTHQRCESDVCDDAGARPDAARPDAAAHVDGGLLDGARRDAERPDGHTSDAGTLCSGATDRFSYGCVFAATGTLPAGRASTLPIFFEGCECRECRSEIDGDRIRLHTRACDHECAECTFEASCPVPPLPTGRYDMIVDDVWIGSVSAEPLEPTDLGRPRCLSRQESDPPLACAEGPRAALVGVARTCMRELIDVGASPRIALHATLPCERSTGTCTTALDGRRLVVTPEASACDRECMPGSLVETTIRCVGPPLRDGTYRIEISAPGALITRTLTVRDITSPGDVICADAI